jgi:hypothetical protein
MNRRQFMIAGAGLTFASKGLTLAETAAEPKVIPTLEELIKRTQRVFTLSIDQLMKFKMWALNEKQKRFVIDMDSATRDGSHIDFISKELPVDTWLGVLLIDDENWLVRQKSVFKSVEREASFQAHYRHDWRNV